MMSSHPVRIVLAGGGTGGHLFPAIAIADRIRELLKDTTDVDIRFVGTRRGLEYRMQDKLGYPLHLINVRGIARSFTLTNILVPFVLVAALVKSYLFLNKYMPDIVVGTGGYVSLPVLKAASWKCIPTVLQEQNSYPGISTRQLAGKARRIYLGFAKAQEYLQSHAGIIITGNPVRRAIVEGNRDEAIKSFDLDTSKKTILVLGGSQGARGINNAVLRSLEKADIPDTYQLLWQTGKTEYEYISEKVKGSRCRVAVIPFVHDMQKLYAAADIAIARAGALSLAELVACRVPSILIPYPYAAGDHQRKNARFLEERNMAIVVDENELSGVDLVDKTVEFAASEKYSRMKQTLLKETENKKPAVDRIAEDIIELIHETREARA